MTNRRAIRLLEILAKHHRVAYNSYQRYLEQPDTANGQRDLARWRRNNAAFDATLIELGALLGAPWANNKG